MTKRLAVHLSDPDAVLVTSAGRPLCARRSERVTTDSFDVTCKDCLRLLKRRAESGKRDVLMEEALRSLARLIAGPPVEPSPTLTPDLWHRMRCRQAVSRGEQSTTDEPWTHTVSAQTLRLHCRCEVCCADLDNAKAKIEWEWEQELRPHRRHRHEFGSARAALELLARWRRDGVATRSSAGSAQSRAEETARLGTAVQTTMRTDRDALEIRRAVMAADVERACLWAFSEAAERRGLSREVCVSILLDSVSGARSVEFWVEATGATERAVKALVRHGLRATTTRLAVDGYIPMPRDAAQCAEIEAMRARSAA